MLTLKQGIERCLEVLLELIFHLDAFSDSLFRVIAHMFAPGPFRL